MKICNMLFNDLNFEPDALQPCCNVRDTTVPRFAFHGGPVDMAAYRAHIAAVFERLQHDAALCSGCPELLEGEGEMPEDAGLYVRFRSVSLNQHRFFCNCRCVYCNLWSARGQEPPYAVLPALQSLIGQDALRSNALFSWGGGEPGILKDFDTACRLIREHGFRQYVHTNALRPSTAMEELLHAHAGRINISLDSGSPAGYAAVKGLDGWSAVLRTLERYAAASAGWDGIDLKYIIFDATNAIPEVEGFFRICERFGVQSVHYSLDFREINAHTVSDKTCLAAAYFKNRAAQLGLRHTAVFIDHARQARIDELAARHFGYGA